MVASLRARSGGLRVRQRTPGFMVGMLERHVRLFERKYGCSSARMAEAVGRGERYDTPEIAGWLASYQELLDLRGLADRTAG